MMKWKKSMAIMMAGCMTMGLLGGCGSKNGSGDSSAQNSDAFSIGYVNLADTDVFCMSRENALKAVVDDSRYSISFTDGNNDNQKQLDQANSFLAKNVDLLMLVPADSEAITPAIDAANQKGTPVICFGIRANSGEYTFVGSDDTEAGKLQGEYMAENLPENAKILYCAGSEGYQQTTQRRDGFKEALESAGRTDVEILDEQSGEYDKSKAMEVCDSWIQSFSDGSGGVEFDAIVCANDQMALGCAESLKGAGILKGNNEVLISGVDGTDDGIAAVKEGNMAQTVLQDAQGQAEAAYEAIQTIDNGEEPEEEYIVPFQSITKENVDEM
mgnify:CR=1 FL=1